MEALQNLTALTTCADHFDVLLAKPVVLHLSSKIHNLQLTVGKLFWNTQLRLLCKCVCLISVMFPPFKPTASRNVKATLLDHCSLDIHSDCGIQARLSNVISSSFPLCLPPLGDCTWSVYCGAGLGHLWRTGVVQQWEHKRWIIIWITMCFDTSNRPQCSCIAELQGNPSCVSLVAVARSNACMHKFWWIYIRGVSTWWLRVIYV